MSNYEPGMAESFRSLLANREAEVRALLRATGDLSEHVTPEASTHEVIDFKDMAVEQSQAVVDDAKAEQATEELQQILAARGRLDDQSYGYCLDCGEAIDERRLRALPAAPYCTPCQAVHEHEHDRAAALRR